MIILAKLLLAHLAGDFAFQPKAWVKDKEKKKAKSAKLYLHILIHGALVQLFLWDKRYWWLTLVLMGSHAAIDMVKLYAQREKTKNRWFAIDQLLHLAVILALWLFYTKPMLSVQALFHSPAIWIYGIAILFITNVSGILIQVVLSNWAHALKEADGESLQHAGKYIGVMERLLVFVFIVAGNWEAIGFLLAAKSIFRFGDLKEAKDRKLTEYILMGTLLSFGIAIATAMAVMEMTD